MNKNLFIILLIFISAVITAGTLDNTIELGLQKLSLLKFGAVPCFCPDPNVECKLPTNQQACTSVTSSTPP